MGELRHGIASAHHQYTSSSAPSTDLHTLVAARHTVRDSRQGSMPWSDKGTYYTVTSSVASSIPMPMAPETTTSALICMVPDAQPCLQRPTSTPKSRPREHPDRPADCMRAGLALMGSSSVNGILWGSCDTASPVHTTNRPRAAPLSLRRGLWLRTCGGHAAVLRAVCLGVTRAHTVAWPRVWLVAPPCRWHPKPPPRKLSA